VTENEIPPDEDGERIDLRPTGLVRIYIEGKAGESARYRLRRPFFGELKSMRLAAERMQEEIEDLSNRTAQQARELGADAEAVAKDENLTDDDRREAETKLRRRGREISQELIDAADGLRLEWWGQVFDTVSLDGTPPELPGWCVDPNLAPKLMNHWRTAPFRPVD
jgi:hypothetical protein